MKNIKVIDGSNALQLRKYVTDQIDGDPLWTSKFLSTNPEALLQVHLDFLDVGADVIHTASYQSSIPGFMKHLNLDKKGSYDLIKESVRIAKRAVNIFLDKNPNAEKPLIAGAVAPYGAHLCDGSEYTGSYIGKVDKETMKAYHRIKISALVEEGADLLAIETVPAIAEAEALLEVLKEHPNQKAWLSFQCKDSLHTANGDSFAKAVQKCWKLASDQLVAVGCNCVNPNYVSTLLKSAKDEDSQNIPFVVYSNSGEEYSSDKEWIGKEKCRNLGDYVENWLNLGVKYVGSCCRTDAKDTVNIRRAVKKWLLENK